jgi:hypothetical protein
MKTPEQHIFGEFMTAASIRFIPSDDPDDEKTY